MVGQEQEQRQRVSGEKERSDAQAEVRKLRQLMCAIWEYGMSGATGTSKTLKIFSKKFT